MTRITIKPCPVVLPLHKLTVLKKVDTIVVHCSATKVSQKVDASLIHAWHIARKFACIGYHYVINRDGTIQKGRPDSFMGAHVAGHNSHTLGICMVGGLDANGKPENNYTKEQYMSLRMLSLDLLDAHPLVHLSNKDSILGHRDLSPDINGDGEITSNEWLKDCPCFNVKTWATDNLR